MLIRWRSAQDEQRPFVLSVALEGRSRSTLRALRLLFPPPFERVMQIIWLGGPQPVRPSPQPLSLQGRGALVFPSPLEGEGGPEPVEGPGEGACDPCR